MSSSARPYATPAEVPVTLSVIWKYPLAGVTQDVAMPAGARVLTLQVQGSVPTLWALINPQATAEARRFRFHGTGEPLEGPGAYIGTVHLAGGSLVLHCFEEDVHG